VIHVVHPTGNEFVRALLSELESSQADFRYWTTIATKGGGLFRCLPANIQSLLQRRSYPVSRKRIRTHPWREWARLLAPGLGWNGLVAHETGWACADAIYQDLDRHVAKRLSSDCQSGEGDPWVYAYEDGALHCFEAAARAGIRRAYELPIAYWETSRRLLEEEAERWPDWAPTLVGPSDSKAKLERKTRELELAEIIVVPSHFVERSLPDWVAAPQRVVVAEFGSPSLGEIKTGERKAERQSAVVGQPMRVLFAGSMSQRKGLADVFEAVRLLSRSDLELVVMGSPLVAMEFYRKQGVNFLHEPPRPHDAVLRLMQTCDVLVLPSIVEGRALVQQEALACGLPILVTPNAGGEDLVVEGETGFLVPIRSPEALAARLEWFAGHRGDLIAMREACRTKSAQYSWDRYARRVLGNLGPRGRSANLPSMVSSIS